MALKPLLHSYFDGIDNVAEMAHFLVYEPFTPNDPWLAACTIPELTDIHNQSSKIIPNKKNALSNKKNVFFQCFIQKKNS